MLQFTHMLTKDEIKQLRQIIKEENEPINKKLDYQGKKLDNLTSEVSHIKSDVSHIKTAIKPLATKQDVEKEIDNSKTEILSAVLALDSKVVTKVHKHTKSINALHEGTGVPDPNTH